MTEAQDLRDLAAQIEKLCREHQAGSMAHKAVDALVDYLRLRAKTMEIDCLEAEIEWWRAKAAALHIKYIDALVREEAALTQVGKTTSSPSALS